MNTNRISIFLLFMFSFILFTLCSSCNEDNEKHKDKTCNNNYEIEITNRTIYKSIIRYLDSIPYNKGDGGLISVSFKQSDKKSKYKITWKKNGILSHEKPYFYSIVNNYPIVFFNSEESMIYNPKVRYEIIQRFNIKEYAYLTYGCDELIITFCHDTTKYRIDYLKWPPKMPTSPPSKDTLCD